jgi:uncharacterized membrane protein YvbJ
MGLGTTFALMRNIKPTQKCKRCGLRYATDEENCPHCHDLDDIELGHLLRRIKKESRSNADLGMKLLYTALICTIILLLIALTT